ncbi:MAG: amino acid adenylation domain-containing protein [Desulfobacterium sp.]|nr:amino acid adenylation domain-containing protein [Desulfobacterium sp.]
MMLIPENNLGTLVLTSEEEYLEIRMAVREKMTIPGDFDDDDNLIELGLDSLKIMRLVNRWRKAGSSVTFVELIEKPRLRDWVALLVAKKTAALPEGGSSETVKINDRAPFPLTDVQYAYWVGRDDDQPFGGIGCHAYLELDGKNVDPDRLQLAWKKILDRHPMLNARFLSDGTQKIQAGRTNCTVVVHDLISKAGGRLKVDLEEIRNRMSHRRLAVEKGEVVGLELTLLPQGITRLHFDIDLLVADVQSLHIVLRDLASEYAGISLPAPPDWNFAKYLHHESTQRELEKKRAGEYWHGRLEALPKAPGLPLIMKPDSIRTPVFKRRQYVLDNTDWQCLKKQAALHQVTPAMVLLAVYAHVLDRWSSHSRFLINIPLFDRPTGDGGVEDVVADFTNLLLLAVDCRPRQSFSERVKSIQAQFYRDSAHSAYSGVQVQRDMARLHQGERMFAPVVFACNLGTPLISRECSKTLGKLSYMISQTPQVWLDFQTYETDEGLLLAWDSVEGLFPDGMINDMFSAYFSMIRNLAQNASAWEQIGFNLMPEYQSRLREKANDTRAPISEDLLHTLFFHQADRNPEKEALVTTGKRMTYKELALRAEQLGQLLQTQGIVPNDLVAVVMEKGWEQVVAVMGILWAGAAYLPVDAAMPKARLRKILENGNVRIALTQSWQQEKVDWPKGVKWFAVDKTGVPPGRIPFKPVQQIEDLAYVIYTSGSTGEPKGVMIDHGGAVNTILDINRRFGVGPEERVIGLSDLGFDLSVYDIFGTLGAGGTLVLPDSTSVKDPAHWLGWMENEGITLWNSVPQLMQMLIESVSGETNVLPANLRLVMLSGDWIPVDLPGKITTCFPNARVIGLGGATEASIWSILYPIDSLDPHAKSIPYGRSMDNQQFYVLNQHMESCPDWVTGDLYIGGIGLAKGYRHDEEKTRTSFVNHPVSGISLYKTGDLGRSLPDGTIEFQGREDHQVKIRGYRIELGEVESAIKQHPNISDAVVATIDNGQKETSLMGYLVGRQNRYRGAGDEDPASSGKPEFFWADLKQAAEKARLLLPGPDRDGLFHPFWRKLDRVYEKSLYVAFEHLGIFNRANQSCSLDEIMQTFGIQPRYKRWMNRALQFLTRKGILKKNGQFFSNPAPLNWQAGVSVNRGQDITRSSLCSDIKHIDGFTDGVVNVIWFASRNLADILVGKIHSAEIYVGDDVKAVYKSLFDPCNVLLSEIMAFISSSGGPLEILEVGAGLGTATGHILPRLSGKDTQYRFTDISKYFLRKAEERFTDYSYLKYDLLDLDQDPRQQGYESRSFDVVIASSMLHDVKSVKQSLRYLKSLLKTGGILLLLEETRFHPSFDLHMGLQQGFDQFEDLEIRKTHPLLSGDQWLSFLNAAGFEGGMVLNRKGSRTDIMGFDVIMATADGQSAVPDFGELKNFLTDLLPAYMIPGFFMEIDAVPISANGKVDRKKLPVPHVWESENSKFPSDLPGTYQESVIAEIWRAVLGMDQIGVTDDFFAIGGDSLIATRIVSRISRSFEIPFTLPMLFENSTIAALSQKIDLLRNHEENQGGSPLPGIAFHPRDRCQPFPMTSVQEAYWIGRNTVFELGNTSAQIYCEIEIASVGVAVLEAAWQKLIERHGMLRAVFLPDGQQKVLEQVPPYKFQVAVPEGVGRDAFEGKLEDVRAEMSSQVISADTWPLFDIRVSILSENLVRLHICMDALIVDAWSFFSIFNEWHQLIENPGLALPPMDVTFRDYVLAEKQFEGSGLFVRDKAYWFDRIPLLPPAPELPLAVPLSSISRPIFNRRTMTLDKIKWEKIKSIAMEQGLTPSCVLLAAYAAVLQNWSRNKKFTINLTLFNRLPLHPQVNDVLGDFTSLTLLSVDGVTPESFAELSKQIQRQLWQDIEHRHFSGVHVLREIAKNENRIGKALMPIVFTSALSLGALGRDATSVLNRMGTFVYGLAQTPQVALDHQVMEQQGSLVCNWDAVDPLFPPGMVDDMFAAYGRLIEQLAEDTSFWLAKVPELIPEHQKKRRIEINNTATDIHQPYLLHELFAKQARINGDKPAICSPNKKIQYGELDAMSRMLGARLRESGVKPNTLVAVVMEKGWEQVPAVLGILYSGAAYLPIDASVPKDRLWHLLKDGQANFILTQSWLKNKLEWPDGVTCLAVDGLEAPTLDGVAEPDVVQTRDDLAYVIHTSGSTGRPKGVMVDHRGAVNTILDINKRFGLGPGDRVLALSALNFDLSVFDIFGTLAAGGTIVLPDSSGVKDPGHWLTLMAQESVTVWNSVPALMQMLVEYAAGRRESLPDSLRLALLSGDWIPLDLPAKIRAAAGHAEIISLGGATEASVWSILYPIDDIDPKWKSIPYGRPMANQSFYVFNENMENCPDRVTGQLYIGGTGLAKGYWGDKEKTDASFIQHPETGIPLYRTGDLGRFLPDGNIEFLGREDHQVKINGYRIELGEIESALKQIDSIEDAIVVTQTDFQGKRYLAGHVIQDKDTGYSNSELKGLLKRILPEYMVPSFYFLCESFPVTANGKIDRKKLAGSGKVSFQKESAKYIAPETKVEQEISAMVKDLIGVDKVSIKDVFFDLGVTSMDLVKLQNKLNTTSEKNVSIVDIFEYPTISSLAAFITREDQQSTGINRADKRGEIRMKSNRRRYRTAQKKPATQTV